MKKMRSVKTTALLITLPTVVTAMVVLSLLGYTGAKRSIQQSINNEMELCLSTAVESIEKSLAKNRMVVETMARAVESTKDGLQEADYGKILTSFIGSNAETFGGGIWFEPYAYEAGRQYFSPYCMREGDKVVYVDNYSLGDGVYYTDQGWYTNVTNTKKTAVWSAPYYDEFAKISMVTSSAPFYDKSGKLMGVATTDIDLTQMQKMVTSLQVHDTGRAFLIDQSGTYIADADSAKLLQQSITGEQNATLAALGKQIVSQKNGSGSYTENGETYLTWYAEVPESGWLIATVISERNLYASITALGRNLLLLCIFFIVLVSIVLINYIKRGIVKPLAGLATATGRIAAGDLDVKVEVKTQNEIGVASHSLSQTVDRLKNYVDYIGEVSTILNQVADGNLDFQLRHSYDGEFARLKDALLHIQRTLVATIRDITQTSEQVTLSSGEISNAAQSLSRGSIGQAGSIEEISQRVAEISASIEENSNRLEQADSRSRSVANEVSESNRKMQQMTSAMADISERSGQIGKIIKTIEDIAFQTNILALNAAVEAARAGAAGKGFAVVADEVRNLAGKSAEAAKNTTALIEGTVSAVQNGTRIADETAASLASVVEGVDDTSRLINEIAEMSAGQVRSIEQINAGISQVSSIVSNNSAMAQESAAKSEELFAQASDLRESVNKFRLSSNTREQVQPDRTADGLVWESSDAGKY